MLQTPSSYPPTPFTVPPICDSQDLTGNQSDRVLSIAFIDGVKNIVLHLLNSSIGRSSVMAVRSTTPARCIMSVCVYDPQFFSVRAGLINLQRDYGLIVLLKPFSVS